jgi:hypothetical protein
MICSSLVLGMKRTIEKCGSVLAVIESGVRKWLQVINRNRFIASTRDLSRARRNPPTEPLLGYMITNFNDISFEDGNVLEMCLDWFDAYTTISCVPENYLSTLLKGVLPPRSSSSILQSSHTPAHHMSTPLLGPSFSGPHSIHRAIMMQQIR